MRYAVKYRRADGGVVDRWCGPDGVPAATPSGKPDVLPLSLPQRFLASFGAKAKPRARLTSPIPHLEGPTQKALEISREQYEALGSITEPDGELRWRVLAGELVASEGLAPIYVDGGRITDAPPTNSGTLRIERVQGRG